MVANRNGFFYVLDRATASCWSASRSPTRPGRARSGRDGQPIVLNDGSKGCVPDQWGGTNFMPPSFDPALGLFFVTARETCAAYRPAEAGDRRPAA